MASKLSRKQLAEALDTVPVDQILGKDVSRELTAKQKRFALEVAKGNTKAEAYRTAYKRDATKRTIVAKPYELARDARIKREIEAYQAALEAAKYRTPAALRELVVQSLVNTILNEETAPAVKVQAARVLGTVTEVAAFTERKEIRTIKSSDETRAQVLNQLRALMNAQAVDAKSIERDADSLLRELAPPDAEMGEDEPHHTPAPHDASDGTEPQLHTIPPEQSQNLLDTPPPDKNVQL